MIRNESQKMRQTMKDSFKNQPNLALKGSTFDAQHLDRFITRPKTAATKTPSKRYSSNRKSKLLTDRNKNVSKP